MKYLLREWSHESNSWEKHLTSHSQKMERNNLIIYWKINVGGIPNSKEDCIIKWTLITTFFLPLLYWFSLQPEASIVAKYKSVLSNYTRLVYFQLSKCLLSKCKTILSKYKSALSKYKVTFGTLGTESLEPRTFLIPRVPRTRFLERVPSKPREQNLNPPITETSGTQPSEPGTLEPQNLSEPIETRTRFPELAPEPQNLSFGAGSRHRNQFPKPVPGTRFLPGTAPARAEHTEIYSAKTP